MEIRWTDCVKNEEVLQRIKEERNFLHTIKRGMANHTGHFWHRNCLLKQVTEGKTEGMMGGPGRKHKQLLEIKRGSIRSHSVEKSLWKEVWTSHKTDYVMMFRDAATDYT